MLRLVRNAFKVARSPLSRRVAMSVFAGIIAIEAAILLPSYLRRKNHLLNELEEKGRIVAVNAIKGTNGHNPRDMLAAMHHGAAKHVVPEVTVPSAVIERWILDHLMHSEFVRGASLVSKSGVIVDRRGDVDKAPGFNVAETSIQRARSADDRYYHVYWPPSVTGLDYGFALTLDSSDIDGKLDAYLFRIVQLVVLIALFLTVIAMIAVGVSIIFPMLRLRDELDAIGNDTKKRLPVRDVSRANEFGGLVFQINNMLSRIDANWEQVEKIAKFPSENRNPVLRLSKDGRLQYANPVCYEIDGLLGPDRKEPDPAIREAAYRAADEATTTLTELTIGDRTYLFQCVPIDRAGYVNVYGRDISEEFRAKAALERANAGLEKKISERTRLIELFQAMTVEANQGTELQSVLANCTKLILSFLDWEIGHVLVSEQGILRSTDTWSTTDRAAAQPLIDASAALEFDQNVCMPGSVIRNGAPVWQDRAKKLLASPRGPAFQELGIRTGFAFPVYENGELAAVLEFYSTDRHPPRDDVMKVVRSVGTQLGRVAERSRSQAQLVSPRGRKPSA